MFVDDLVDGHWSAMERGRSGERYILGGDNLTMREMLDTVDEISGRKHFRVSVGRWLPLAVGYLQMAKTVFGIAPLVTPGFLRMYMSDSALDCSKAINELGYSPRTFAEGLQVLYDWMEEVRPTKDHKRAVKERQTSQKQSSPAEQASS